MTTTGLGRAWRWLRRGRAELLLALIVVTALPDAGATTMLAPSPQALSAAMATQRIVLLGEVHDNGIQHALRVDALRHLVEAGGRPALAFEQFDRDQQAEIDRLRRDRPGDVDALVALGARSWKWDYYRPFLQLALDHGLPIVAANLSRADAVRVSTQGWSAVFDASEQAELGLDHLPPGFVAAHEQAVAEGHCNLLPPEMVAALARAQIARDIVLARALRPYAQHGVVLLTGNGHARKDIGVPFWLTAEERRGMVSIALLEPDPRDAGDAAPTWHQSYDVVIETAAAARADPCESLRKRFRPPAAN